MLLMVADGDRRHQRGDPQQQHPGDWGGLSSGQGPHFISFGSVVKIRLSVSSNENSDIFRPFLLTEIVKMRIGNGKIRKMENKTGDVAIAVSRI